MKPSELLCRFRESKDFILMADKLKNPLADKSLIIDGLSGSAITVIISSAFGILQRPFIVIAKDKESAAYHFNDLENWLEEKHLNYEKRSIFYFPSSYKKPFENSKFDNANILLRSEVIKKLLTEPDNFIVVSYPEALSEKIVTKQELLKNTLILNLGEKVSVDFILELLLEFCFVKVDFVVEPGQFSIRGCIIDIFSFSNDFPFRIELMDDLVESLRTFNPENQLSVDKFSQISIVPNISQLDPKFKSDDFFSLVPQNSVIWIDDPDFCIQKIQNGFENARDIFNTPAPGIQSSTKDIFLTGHDFAVKMAQYTKVEFRNKLPDPNSLANENSVHFDFSPQPLFNKNFDLLLSDLTEKTVKGYSNYILADNLRQLTRIQSIFEIIAGEKDYKLRLDSQYLPITIHEGFIDNNSKLTLYTDHQIFGRYHRYRMRDKLPGKKALTIRELNYLKPGDYITHVDHGVGIFSGLEKIEVNGKVQEAIRLIYKGNDILYISIHSLHRISKYSSREGTEPTLNRLGSPTWQILKNKTKQKVKDIAKDLIKLYAERKSKKGFAFSPDTYLQNELEASFLYEDTPDQLKATEDVKGDMEKEYPMDRLICGDVGFGKTEVAIRAAFKAVADSKQVAILVPTTILALQHFHTFNDRLKDFPCKVDYINRFRSAKDKTRILIHLTEGKIDIIIGTHRLVSNDVMFKDLGLLIIDEEQKFGVSAKEKIKKLKVNIDTLTLTATPIPRTLHFSLMGARDLSLITTPPPNRYPIFTELNEYNDDLVREAILNEIKRAGQVFFIHNRVNNIVEVAGRIKALCPDARVAIGHGQMNGGELEKIMVDFIDGNYDVLVATSIIESGLDIPNANTIIINNAHMFGLSDLHQMRGRVGRSNKKAYCYLLTPPLTTITDEARKRLKTIEEFSELGSGFNIAMRDLDIRGVGNLLGAEQSGFISELGFEMYHKILDEAINELKNDQYKDLIDDKTQENQNYSGDCVIDTDLPLHIPSSYVENSSERFLLYKELATIESEDQLQKYKLILADRFGTLPPEAEGLFTAVRLKWLARKLGFEKVILKSGLFIGIFISHPDSPFYNSATFLSLMHFAQNRPRYCKIKEENNRLSITIKSIDSIEQAYGLLQQMQSVEV